MGALIRALTNNAVENIEEALGMTDATSSAMKHAIAEWYAAWYGRAPTKTEDPCQRLPYAIVNKLCKATFGEYDSGLQHTDSAKGKYLDRVRNTFDACKTSFMTQAMPTALLSLFRGVIRCLRKVWTATKKSLFATMNCNGKRYILPK